jgi:hypothetical protein
MRTNPQATEIAKEISEDVLPELYTGDPVAIRNSSSSSGNIIIGRWVGWQVQGDLHKFTESAVGTVKNVFERQNIRIRDDADKALELSVYDAKSEQEGLRFRATTALRVRTGGGLEKEYVGSRHYTNGHRTTPAIEGALALCVEQMLNDQEIIDYLEN